METYNLPEAMIKAKENPGTIYQTGEDGIAIQFLDSAGCWAKTDYDNSVMLYDHEFHELQPEIQEGDWFRDGAVYTKVLHVIDKDYVMAKDFNQAPHEPTDEYQEHTNYLRQLEQVTDKRKLLFLNAGRLPGQWKAGDIFQTSKRQPFRIAPKDVSSELMEGWGARPVCFVEDRKDRGDTP